MVDKVTHTIDCIKPGAIRILILQNEIQISFRDPPVVFVAKNLGSAGQKKGTITGGVNDSALVKRSVGTTARTLRRSEIFNIGCGVPRNRLQDEFPVVSWVHLEDLKECFVHVRRSCDQRRLLFDHSAAPDPVEWITPAIF